MAGANPAAKLSSLHHQNMFRGSEEEKVAKSIIRMKCSSVSSSSRCCSSSSASCTSSVISSPSLILCSLLLLLSFRQVNCDIFSSTSHLQNLMYLERHMIYQMQDWIAAQESKITQLKDYINEFTLTAGHAQYRAIDPAQADNQIIGNPLQAFQLIKRLTINWSTVKSIMNDNSWKGVEQITHEYESVMPKEEDLHGAALALIRLQDTYNLNMSEMAAGKISGSPADVTMTARDCLYLGKHSFNNGYYGQAIEWFEQALHKANLEGNATAPVDEITPFYSMALTIHNDLLPGYKLNMTSDTAPNPRFMRFLDGDNDDYKNYQALCRGDKLRTPEQEKKLKCYFSNQGSHWLILQPVKVEEFNHFPIYIVMFHDLMTAKETEQVRKMAAPVLQRAKVVTDTNDTAVSTEDISTTRTSHTAWFSSDEHEIVDRISRRIESVTGLSTDMTYSHSELMQVANYGMGGHYTPHYDYLIVDRPENERHLCDERELFAGDRTATLMFYLTDVVQGGATVFPRLGVRLTPKRGSAAFWYNLKRNGEGIEDTVHGACPVLMGEKWVANHWIRENGQIFKRKCSLNPDE